MKRVQKTPHAVLLITALMGGCLTAGCQPTTSTDSPFVLVDRYMEYLRPAEKEAFLRSVGSKGLDATLRELADPSSVWFARYNAYGVVTPKGTLSPNEDMDFIQEGLRVSAELRKCANSFPPARIRKQEN